MRGSDDRNEDEYMVAGRRWPRGRRLANRQGMAMILAILCLAAASILLANLTRMLGVERQNRVTYRHALQTDWLARYGLHHAAGQLASDPTYNGEVLQITLDQITRAGDSATMVRQTRAGQATRQASIEQIGRIRLSIQRTDQSNTLIVIAEYPADAPDQTTKRLTETLSIRNSSTE